MERAKRFLCVAYLFFLSACNEDLLEFLSSQGNALPSGLDGQMLNDSEQEELVKTYLASRSHQSYFSQISNSSIDVLEASTSSDQVCPILLDLPTRGLACLQCTHPNAQVQANILALVLQKSCLRNVAINYLVDGSFGSNYSLLFSHVALLSSEGRQLHLILYLSNGPSQRKWNNTEVISFSTKTSPEMFRNLILDGRDVSTDNSVTLGLRSVVKGVLPLMRFASYRGVRLYLVPMLEDNLDDNSFLIYSNMIRSLIPAGIDYKLVRNPCPGCYSGNGSRVPSGMVGELHTVSSAFGLRNGIVTNDGYEIADSHDEGRVTLADLTSLRDRAGELNDIFILWSGKRQGLSMRDNENLTEIQSPDERIYEIPGISEREALIRFLRSE